MNILVTGGAGFIGSHVVDALLERGDKVTVLDNLSSGYRKNVSVKARFIHGSITDKKIIAKLFSTSHFGAIVHLAAQKNARYSLQDPVFDAQQNIIGSIYVLEAAKQYHVPRVVFTSTGGVMYGEAKVMPTPETEPVHPLSPYAISKYSVEYYLRYYSEVHAVSTIALRLGNVYGPRQDPKGEAGVVAIFLEAMLHNKQPIIFGTGKQTRDYIYVTDAVNAIVAGIDKSIEGHYNIGAGKQTSVNEIYRQLAKLSGMSAKAKRGKAIPGEQRISALHSGLARKQLGWKPRINLGQGLKKTYEWFKDKNNV